MKEGGSAPIAKKSQLRGAMFMMKRGARAQKEKAAQAPPEVMSTTGKRNKVSLGRDGTQGEHANL
jgi:hypothetical protein